MTPSAWNAAATSEIVHRRAGGRRRYNARRRKEQVERRRKVAVMLRDYPPDARGALADIARNLGVNRSTITRDVRALGFIADFMRGNPRASITWRAQSAKIIFGREW